MRPTVLALALSLFASALLGAEHHVFLAPHAPLSENDRAELKAKGIDILQPTAGGRYIARVAHGASDSRIASIDAITFDDKVHPSVRRELGRGRTWIDVAVYFHGDITFEDARASIISAGGALDDLFATGFEPMKRVKARVAPQSVSTLVANDNVLMISGPRRLIPETHNAISATVSHVDEVQKAPYGLTGKGVAVSLFELAEGQATHIEFAGRSTVFATGGATGDKTHATHVAGTIAASGLRIEAKGMAPAATITQFCVPAGSNGCRTDWTIEKNTKLAPLGVVVDNNSWGYILGWGVPSGGYPVWDESDIYFGAYDYEVTAPIDQISIEKNVLFVHSAGNDGDGQVLASNGEHLHVDDEGNTITDKVHCYSKNGSGTDCAGACTPGPPYCETIRHQAALPYDTLSVTAAAKNAVTVGAVDASKKALNLSSGGPAKDGRVKPDVVARGGSVLSSAPINSYAIASGTSMAAPVVTGIAALITERWRNTFGTTPKPQDLKALIIAGTEDLGLPGPDYLYGFGLVNAKTSIDLVDPKKVNSLTITGTGDIEEIMIALESPGPLRAVLQWPDPPVFLPANQVHTAKALVNDLDLTVVDSAGHLLLPYVLDKTKPAQAATTGTNNIDNTEVVHIANAQPGVYRVRVRGGNVTTAPQVATVVTSTRRARVCVDNTESNDSAETAYGNLQPGQLVNAGFCTGSDAADFYKFEVTKAGNAGVVITTGDTSVVVQLTGGVNLTQTVLPYSSVTISGNIASASLTSPVKVTVRVTPYAGIGLEPDYELVPQFEQSAGPRRRAARK